MLTLRLLWVLIRRLPATSALAISENGGTQPWTLADHIGADTWTLLAQVNSKKGKAPKDHPAREAARSKQKGIALSRRRGAHDRAMARNAERLSRAGR
ncbi:hypothetical protein [Rhodococcus globerulus]|uniref:Transposase n=1 Tax=Rhodococcus globerulus TaxID=33008 RepID=A0ABU4C3M4_RHOGO|nr:hypothetical protein [Rhodococcus globerulus]MDV6271107.1 hypothetical protein [Rhodococcus globerulus]